ncbi:MAG: bifunctional DNA primase/polymerase [Myxococcales bacterium]|nr:bifunctional DNA primase/polymerase [Myxococcales bacterium]
MNAQVEELLSAALELIALGWHVLPLRARDKRPSIAGGVHAATTCQTVVRRWASEGRLGNLGVATGRRSQLIVVDLDDAEAEIQLIRQAEAEGGLPATARCRTPRGLHLYFGYRPGLKNATRIGGMSLDVRTDGGYVVVPPSQTAGAYRWERDHSPWLQEVAPLPDWLLTHLKAEKRGRARVDRRPVTRTTSNGPSRFGQRVLRNACDEVARAARGKRNDRLNRAAYRVGRLMDAGGLPEQGVIDALVDACHANGLITDDGEGSVLATIRSGMAAGRAQPSVTQGRS